MPAEPKVEAATRFGRIPFDLYALEHWDYDAPTENDAEQWKSLGRNYLKMESLERRPYHERAQSLRCKATATPHPKLNFENIERVLKPFQTRKKRHAGELSDTSSPVWVLTCYDKALSSYLFDLEFFGDVGKDDGSSDVHMTFFDETLYNFEDDAEALRLRLLERMPGLCDKRRSHYRENHGRSNRRIRDTLEGKSNRMATYVLVADREAIENDFVKVMWLDDHGECLGITKMAPNEPSNMRVMFGEGFDMLEAIQTYGLDANDGVEDSEGTLGNKGQEDHAAGTSDAAQHAMIQPSHIYQLEEKVMQTAHYKQGYKAGYEEGFRVGMARNQKVSRNVDRDAQ